MTTTLLKAKRAATGGGIVAVLTALALTLLGGNAFAVDKTLTFSGSFPLIGTQTVTTVTHVNIPTSTKRGTTVTVPFSIDVDAGQTAADGLRLVGAKSFSGTITASTSVKASNGTVYKVPVSLPIASTAVPATGPLKFTASGSVAFAVPATAATGTATVSVDPTASSRIVTTSALGTFDVALTLSPASQNTVLGTSTVTA
ncbi:DUF6801 domain-containing protein [Actinokineospora bangkokensis]|uniref:DUF6801 domain-containing protein n=1 Tax=Actinokineospora bangkokensis TaxID=1193682 RepID=A0A1Q9LKZ3_9PSEU|nr:DUF6801 domain-containing protein [Actinokineospora bangkokensis]OLR92698.1 hypothetical protein BJP25_22000 [Actinokineospora bangkokensis]